LFLCSSLSLSLSLSLSIFMPPGKFPESWIMNHGGSCRGCYVPFFNEPSNVNSFFGIIVYQPITPSSSVWFTIVVIAQVGFILGVVGATTLLGS
jgi:hypothetical protein